MAAVGYSKKVMEHFLNPHNVGVIEHADGYGKVGNPVGRLAAGLPLRPAA